MEPTNVALKIMELSTDKNDPDHKYQKKELELYAELTRRGALNHPNIIMYFAFVEYELSNVHFVYMELCDMNLKEWMAKDSWGMDKKVGAALKKHIIFEICSGVNHLHKNEIIHRDIAPSNILLKYVEGPDFPTVKVADFNVFTIHARARAKASHTAKIGQKPYQAPEVQAIVQYDDRERAMYGCSADIWSIGTVAYQMYTRKLFNKLTEKQIRDRRCNIEEKLMVEIPDDKKLNDFLFKCLQWEAKDRAQCSDLLTHNFLESSNPSAMISPCNLTHATTMPMEATEANRAHCSARPLPLLSNMFSSRQLVSDSNR